MESLELKQFSDSLAHHWLFPSYSLINKIMIQMKIANVFFRVPHISQLFTMLTCVPHTYLVFFSPKNQLSKIGMHFLSRKADFFYTGMEEWKHGDMAKLCPFSCSCQPQGSSPFGFRGPVLAFSQLLRLLAEQLPPTHPWL